MHRRPSCARPGCQGHTGAWLTYDYAGQRVWLDDAPDPEGGDQWPLCANHAARLRAPQGWSQVDRRVAAPSRFEPPTALVS
jgi:hypothetical protein